MQSRFIKFDIVILTKSRVEHVEGHAVAFLSSRDRDKSLVAIVLRFIDLDHATAHGTNLVDLLSTLADDSANHVIGNKDLLSNWGTRHTALDWLTLGTRMSLRGSMPADLRLHERGAIRSRRLSTVGNGLHRRVRNVAGGVVGGIRSTELLSAAIVVSLVVLRSTKLATCGSRVVGNNLHASGDGASGGAASRSIGRCGRAAVSFVQLLEKSATNIVSSDVNGVCDTHHNQRALARSREARVRSVQSSARSILDFSDSGTTLTNDGADQHVGDEKTQGIRLRGGSGRLAKGLIVESADDQTKSLESVVLALMKLTITDIRMNLTLATASTTPLTVRMRSTAPFW